MPVVNFWALRCRFLHGGTCASLRSRLLWRQVGGIGRTSHFSERPRKGRRLSAISGQEIVLDRE